MALEVTLEKVLDLIRENIEIEDISYLQLDEDLVQYGMDSMKFIQMVISLEEEFACELPDEKLIYMEMNTVNKIYHTMLESSMEG